MQVKVLDVVSALCLGGATYAFVAAPLSGSGQVYVAYVCVSAILWIVGACAFVKTACSRF